MNCHNSATAESRNGDNHTRFHAKTPESRNDENILNSHEDLTSRNNDSSKAFALKRFCLFVCWVKLALKNFCLQYAFLKKGRNARHLS